MGLFVDPIVLGAAQEDSAYIKDVSAVDTVDDDGDGRYSEFSVRIRADTECRGCNDETEDSPDIEPEFHVAFEGAGGDEVELGWIEEHDNNDPDFDETYPVPESVRRDLSELERPITMVVEFWDQDPTFDDHIDTDSQRLRFESQSDDTNTEPTARVRYDPSSPHVNETVTFDGSESSDPEGEVVGYEWDLAGDGRTDSEGERVRHRFTQPGAHTVTLTVTDNVGATATERITVDVRNSPPEAAFDVSPSEPTVGSSVTFDASASEDREGPIASYEWDLTGDRQTDATGVRVSHTYTDNRDYDVRLLVTDAWDEQDAVGKTVSIYQDTDGDGLADRREERLGTDPADSDTDGDGLSDHREVEELDTDPADEDTDDDGLPDTREVEELDTDPADEDTDGDGLSDTREVEELDTDPADEDTDDDGLSDYREVEELDTDPADEDTDDDGLSDHREVEELDTDPKSEDTDGDGLSDTREVEELDTDPRSEDTDDDGLSDHREVEELDTDPADEDTDDDGLSDGADPTPGNVVVPFAPLVAVGLLSSLEHLRYR